MQNLNNDFFFFEFQAMGFFPLIQPTKNDGADPTNLPICLMSWAQLSPLLGSKLQLFLRQTLGQHFLSILTGMYFLQIQLL